MHIHVPVCVCMRVQRFRHFCTIFTQIIISAFPLSEYICTVHRSGCGIYAVSTTVLLPPFSLSIISGVIDIVISAADSCRMAHSLHTHLHLFRYIHIYNLGTFKRALQILHYSPSIYLIPPTWRELSASLPPHTHTHIHMYVCRYVQRLTVIC